MSMSPPPPPPPPASPPPPPPMPPGGSPGGTPPVPGGHTLADAWMRVLARFLDIVILVVIGLIIGAIVGGGSATVSSGTGDGIGQFLVAAVLGLIVGFLYDAVMTKTKGGTPMKLAFGMRVVRADDGSPVEWKHAIIRWAIPGVFSIVPILGGLVALVVVIVSLVFIFTKPLRQAVWDQVAETIVVKAG